MADDDTVSEDDLQAARLLARQTDQVGRASGHRPWRDFLRWASRGRLGRDKGWTVVPDLGTPWQDTISPVRAGWRQRAASLDGAPAGVAPRTAVRAAAAYRERARTEKQASALQGLHAGRTSSPGRKAAMLMDDTERPIPDFSRAARTRVHQRQCVQQAVNRGLLAPDIGAAMCSADAGDWLAFQGFEVVTSLEDLCGPSSGTVTVPDRLADRELHVQANIDQPWQRLQFYRRLLLRGTAAQQSRLLNRTLLQQMWPQRLGPATILHVWEGRFPELRTAARS